MMFAPFPEDWTRCLAVVAHPDDMEYGSAAAVARWTKQGKDVAYLLISRGEAGIDDVDPERSAALRVEEQIASSALVGVTGSPGLPRRVSAACVAPRLALAWPVQPELVIAVNYRETFGGSMLNMADHQNVRSRSTRCVMRPIVGFH